MKSILKQHKRELKRYNNFVGCVSHPQQTGYEYLLEMEEDVQSEIKKVVSFTFTEGEAVKLNTLLANQINLIKNNDPDEYDVECCEFGQEVRNRMEDVLRETI